MVDSYIQGQPDATGKKVDTEQLSVGGSTVERQRVQPSGSFFVHALHDYIALAQAATTDTWTFKSGGAGGTLVATVTITYTDSTKATISTVVRT